MHRFLLGACLALIAGHAVAKDRVVIQTGWTPQAEYGGYYQALATGIYDAHDLEVTLKPGGPQLNAAQVLVGGRADFAILAGNTIALGMVEQAVPFVTVATFFQKDPRMLMAHAENNYRTIADFKGKPILVSNDGRQTYWQFLKSKHGFTDDQIRPYTFNLAPFLTDKRLSLQGYVTSEPFSVRDANVATTYVLLADHGWSTYAHLMMTSRKMIEERPELVQRVVDASIKGWYAYLSGKHQAAFDLILKENPNYPPQLAVDVLGELKKSGIVLSGDALTNGIGATTDARWKAFFDMMVEAGVYKSDLDYKAAYTTKFVNKKIGM
jgi:NitT/TauT family transport system substrate-binding protein